METYFIADPHFGDSNIINNENRPFADVSEMDSEMIRLWNQTVSSDDCVFVLGDVSAYNFEKTQAIVRKLNGRKILIKGNHDTQEIGYYIDCGFYSVSDYPVIYENFWILSHEPLYINNNMPYANIYGHVHGNEIYKDYSKKSFCASAERINYTPVSFQEIKKKVLG